MKKIFIAAFIALTLSACNDDDRLANDDNRGERIAGFPQQSQSVSYFADEGQVTVDVPVVLLGLGNGQAPTEAIEVTYSVNATASTAVEGVEYNFPSSSRTVTIPAGSTIASIPLLVNTGQLNESSATKVVLTLTQATSGTVVLQSANEISVNFVGCLADLAGTYTAVTVNVATGGTLTQLNQAITETGTNSFITQNSGTFNPGQAAIQGYHFSVLCGEIDVPSQPLFNGQFGALELVGVPDSSGSDGHVIDADSFVVKYKANPGSGNYLTWTTTYTRN